MNTIGRNIKQLREQCGMSQNDLANRIGKTRSAISLYENGTTMPRMGVVEDMARVFGVPKSAIIESRYEYSVINFASNDEKELIDLYRAVPDAMKQAVVNMLKSYVEGSK